MALELEVYSREDPFRKVDVLPMVQRPSFLEERTGVGGGSFVIHNDDERAKIESILQDRNIVKAKIDGKVRSGFIIQKKDPTYLATGEKSAELTTVSGNGFKDWFRDASLASEYGQAVTFDTRSFNFSSNASSTATKTGPWYNTPTGTWYDAVSWTRPWHVAKYGGQAGNPYRYKPAEWPDAPDSYWMWANINPEAGNGICYFRTEILAIPKDIGRYSLYVAADDYFEVYIDGQRVATETESSKTFEQTHRYEFSIDEVGIHTIGIKVQNIRGRGALLATVFAEGDPAKQTKARLVTPSKSPNWWMARFPTTPPNWTLGEIWDVLLKEAKDRGVWFAKTVTPGYTKEADSMGKPWSRELEWTFDVGESYLSIANKMQELAADIWIDPETYKLHIAQKRGVDRTTGDLSIATPMLLRPAYDLTSGESKSEWDVKNSLIVQGRGRRQIVRDSASVAKYGVVEDTLSLDADNDLAKIIAEKVVAEASTPTEGATYGVVARDGSTPFVDYQVGDWVMAPGSAGPRTRRRVESISFSADTNSSAINYSVEFDTVFKSRQANLEQWVTKTMNGSIGGKLYNAAQLSAAKPVNSSTSNAGLNIPPVPPVIQTARVLDSFYDNSGVARSAAMVTWNPVTATEDGGSVDNVTYEVWGTNLTPSSIAIQPVPTLMAQTTELRAQITGLEPDASYSITVRALAPTGTVSAESDSFQVDTYSPQQSPATPTAPILTSRATSVTVRWDGNFVNDVNNTASFDSVQAAVSDTPGGPYYFTGGPLNSDGAVALTEIPAGSTMYVVLASKSKSGVYSSFSAESAIVVSNVNSDDLATEITDSIDSAHKEAADAANSAANALTTASGKNARRRGKTEASLSVPPGGWVPGDQWVVENAAGDPVEVRVWNGTAFVPDQILSSELLILGTDGVVRIKDGRITANNLSADAIDGKLIRGVTIIGGLIQGGTIEISGVQSTSTVLSDTITAGTLPNWGFGNYVASLDNTVGHNSVPSVKITNTDDYKNWMGTWYSSIALKNAIAAGDCTVSMWVRYPVTASVNLVYSNIAGDAINVPANTWTQVTVSVPKGTSSGFLVAQAAGINVTHGWADDLVVTTPVYDSRTVRLGRDLTGAPRLNFLDNSGTEVLALTPSGLWSSDGVTGGNVVRVNAGEVVFSHGSGFGDMTINRSGFYKQTAGEKLQIGHQAAGSGSGIEIYTSGSGNAVSVLSPLVMNLPASAYFNVNGPATHTANASQWQNVSGMNTLSINTGFDRKLLVEVDFSCIAGASAGYIMLGVITGGATVTTEQQPSTPSDANRYGMHTPFFAPGTATTAQSAIYGKKIMELNPGTTTFTLRSMRSAAGTHVTNYPTLMITPIRYLDG